ncbi:AbfB domain-containing protein [Streptomyces sp. NPDC020707]|uniref:AbfB domain-containing protein n=1 Tax=Streptomyces ortus TaxID=2867268 RepID=A0ABT3UYT9_9ACTN|nr:AbfB domain-containing protein [Streptomyces ortus]MCX4232739.1 AbfB domain-containing protein [Streptomyces ortus]
MPDRNTESAPAPSPHHLPKVWETGETLDQSPIPGTRRLWLAGALLLAVLASTVTAVTVLDEDRDTSSKDRTENTSVKDEPLVAAPPVAATAPSGKSGLAAPSPSGSTPDKSAPPAEPQGGAGPVPKPSASRSKSASGGKPPAAKPSSARKSVQAVNYPDRYWRLDRDYVGLDRVDPGSSSWSRQGTSFKLVPGLADADCVSFSLGNGRYLRHSQFQLRADRRDGSELFKKDATFCPRPSAFSGAVMLESVNYRGRFLRHRDFRLRLDPYDNSRAYQADSAFRLVKGLG